MLCSGSATAVANDSLVNEKHLYRHLMRDMDYEKAVRPVLDAKDSITVSFGLALISIADLVSKDLV